MAKILEMPKLSPTMEEGVLVAWHKNEGDDVAVDDLLAEVETDKATMEFRAFDKGTLLKRLVTEGANVKLGQPVAIVGRKGGHTSALEDEAGAASAPAAAKGEAPAEDADDADADDADDADDDADDAPASKEKPAKKAATPTADAAKKTKAEAPKAKAPKPLPKGSPLDRTSFLVEPPPDADADADDRAPGDPPACSPRPTRKLAGEGRRPAPRRGSAIAGRIVPGDVDKLAKAGPGTAS